MQISFDQPLKLARAEFDREYLKHHLEANGGKLVKLVPISGMALSNLYRLLKKLGSEECAASVDRSAATVDDRSVTGRRDGH